MKFELRDKEQVVHTATTFRKACRAAIDLGAPEGSIAVLSIWEIKACGKIELAASFDNLGLIGEDECG